MIPMRQFFRIILSKKMERHDTVSRRIEAADAENERVSNRLSDVIRELLNENDKLTGRPAHVRKPRT